MALADQVEEFIGEHRKYSKFNLLDGRPNETVEDLIGGVSDIDGVGKRLARALVYCGITKETLPSVESAFNDRFKGRVTTNGVLFNISQYEPPRFYDCIEDLYQRDLNEMLNQVDEFFDEKRDKNKLNLNYVVSRRTWYLRSQAFCGLNEVNFSSIEKEFEEELGDKLGYVPDIHACIMELYRREVIKGRIDDPNILDYLADAA